MVCVHDNINSSSRRASDANDKQWIINSNPRQLLYISRCVRGEECGQAGGGGRLYTCHAGHGHLLAVSVRRRAWLTNDCRWAESSRAHVQGCAPLVRSPDSYFIPYNVYNAARAILGSVGRLVLNARKCRRKNGAVVVGFASFLAEWAWKSASKYDVVYLSSEDGVVVQPRTQQPPPPPPSCCRWLLRNYSVLICRDSGVQVLQSIKGDGQLTSV